MSSKNIYQEEVHPVLGSIDSEIESAKDQINALEELRDTLIELTDHASYFDSTACGVLELKEDEQAILLAVSNYTLGDRMCEVIKEYDWDNVETYWLEQSEMFQIELRMEYEL